MKSSEMALFKVRVRHQLFAAAIEDFKNEKDVPLTDYIAFLEYKLEKIADIHHHNKPDMREEIGNILMRPIDFVEPEADV